MEMQTIPRLGHEPGQTRQRELEHDVLVHLTGIGSAKWGKIYSHFYQDGRGEIGEVLSQLTHRGHIVIELDGTTRITVAGLRHSTLGSFAA